MEGATEALQEFGVKMHSILNILQITEVLYEQKLIDVEYFRESEKSN